MNGKKVLIIDDDPKLRRLMEYPLSGAGAEVFLTEDGRDGLRKFYSEKPDLVILDLMMPNMNGFEVLSQIKSRKDLCDIKVLIGSARNSDKDRITLLEMGAADFIAKPYNMKQMINKIKNIHKHINFYIKNNN